MRAGDDLLRSARAHAHVTDARDRGLSFLEVLISLVLLGTIVVAVLFGLSTVIIGADRHRDLSVGSAALVDGLEYVKTRNFDTCGAAPTSYRPPDLVRGDLTWSYTVSLVSSDTGTYGGTCTDSHPLQLVSVTVVASDGATTLSGDVVKRDN